MQLLKISIDFGKSNFPIQLIVFLLERKRSVVDGKKENRLLVYRQVSPKRQQEPMLNMQDLVQNYKVKDFMSEVWTGTL